jgi:hypothetical protein
LDWRRAYTLVVDDKFSQSHVTRRRQSCKKSNAPLETNDDDDVCTERTMMQRAQRQQERERRQRVAEGQADDERMRVRDDATLVRMQRLARP